MARLGGNVSDGVTLTNKPW